MPNTKGRIEEKAHMGQKIRTDFPPDKSGYMIGGDEDRVGRPMKGGPRDLSHSIGGEPEQVETYNDVGRKPRK